MNIQFSDLIENAPHAPGVYRMYDSENNLLYVGKAKNLSNRLKQYLDISKLELHKQVMRSLVTHIEWETVATESDALLREQELIKTSKDRAELTSKGIDYLLKNPIKSWCSKDFPLRPEVNLEYLKEFYNLSYYHFLYCIYWF